MYKSHFITYKQRLRTRLKEAGNVLFMILIAVALFAALAYTVTGSTRSSGGDASKEQTTLDASRIVQHANEIENSVQRIKISNGCADEQISFENVLDGGYTNPNSPINYSCHVFRPEGGGVILKKLLPNAPTDIFSSWTKFFGFVGVNDFPQIGLSGCGTACVDFHIFMWIHNQDLCRALNVAEGYGNTLNPLITTGFAYGPQRFVGTFTVLSTFAAPQFIGKRGGCYIYSADPRVMIYYHVILPR